MMNLLCLTTNNKNSINQAYNTAAGKRTLLELVNLLKINLSKFDEKISNIKPVHGPSEKGDILYSLASTEKSLLRLNFINQNIV